MFTTKYRPKKIDDFVGNKQNVQPFIEWLLEWDASDKKKKCALISGVCGIGKSLFVEILLKKHDYNIINLAIDDERDKEYMNNTIKPLIKTKQSLDGQDNVLLVSDIDCGGGDYGFISCLAECIKNSSIPIVCICDNRYDQSIKPILNYCVDFKMTKPAYQDVYRLIYNVVVTEQIRIKESEIKELYEQSNGDIRFMLNTIQFGSRKGKKNIQSTSIFDTTAKLLSMDETIESKYETYWLCNELHPLLIQENYINNTLAVTNPVRKLENLAYSADSLSDVDLFDTYVNKPNWEFQPYVALNTINAGLKCNKKGLIKFPQYLGKISTIYKNRREKVNYENVQLFEKEKPKAKKEAKVKEPKPKKEKESKPKKEAKPKAKNVSQTSDTN
jgi:replication factor C subunit 1